MRNIVIFVLLTRASLEGVDGLGAAFNALLIVIGLFSATQTRKLYVNLALLSWVPYLSFMLFSLTYSSAPSAGFRLFLQTCTFPSILLSVFYVCDNRKYIKKVLFAIICSSLTQIPVAFLQLALGGAERSVKGTFTHPNIFAFYLVALILATYLFFQLPQLGNSRRVIVYLRTSVFFFFMLLIATETRSAWIAIAASLILLGVFADRRLLYPLVLAPLLLFVPQVSERLSDLKTPQVETTIDDVGKGGVVVDSYTWRKLLWDSALTYSEESRVLGEGAGSFNHDTEIFFPIAPDMDAHSAYIHTIYELGITGLLLYLFTFSLPFFFIWKRRARNPKAAWTTLSLILAHAIEAYSDNTIFYLAYDWYAFSILAVGVVIVSQPNHLYEQHRRKLRGDPRITQKVGGSSPGTVHSGTTRAATNPS
ncbi:O-antigen ligase family protein [Rhizobium rhododendri]|uniref:O-antigen ligase family protein n=1 Tax=Rhizobium rhododendri TaxID=2506430 RepID=A0ABY8INB8_9HYPH|nr:O-antigen ligase family protein [Rhizobium rhododendri]WFS25214.1 O-antigen ligase family protein [Rhizobium rhododendri]